MHLPKSLARWVASLSHSHRFLEPTKNGHTERVMVKTSSVPHCVRTASGFHQSATFNAPAGTAQSGQGK